MLFRFDLAHIGLDHLRAIFKHHLKSILAIPLYLAAFSLHQVTLKVDDKLTLLHYNSSNITYYPTMEFNVSSLEMKMNGSTIFHLEALDYLHAYLSSNIPFYLFKKYYFLPKTELFLYKYCKNHFHLNMKFIFAGQTNIIPSPFDMLL